MEELKKTIRKLSKKQREVFDAICVNNDAGHQSKTLASLVKKSLVRQYEQPFRGGAVFRYDVADLLVHRAWCEVCSEDNPEMFEEEN